MKVTIRIPTDPYAYTEVEKEFATNPSPEDVSSMYREYRDAFAAKAGVDDKVMDKFVQNQLEEIGNDIEVYEKMSPEQQKEVQRIKRAIKRITAKENN